MQADFCLCKYNLGLIWLAMSHRMLRIKYGKKRRDNAPSTMNHKNKKLKMFLTNSACATTPTKSSQISVLCVSQ